MKKSVLLLLSLSLGMSAMAQHEILILDLSDDNIIFNENKTWEGIYTNENFTADGYVFSHSAPYGAGYYEGFTASCNTDTANHYDAAGWTANQWGCMAQGGVNLNHDEDEKWWIEAIKGKPFLLNYYSSYSSSSSEYGTSYITSVSGNSFYPSHIYVCNSPWGYYGCTVGDGFATPLAQEGGYYKVTFNGVNTQEGTTRSVDFYLAQRQYSDRNGDGIINQDDNFTLDHWAICDLSELGKVDLIYITMDSSDKGDYGMNTSTLVCLDGLNSILPGAIDKTINNNSRIYAADGYLFLTLNCEQNIKIYNTAGVMVYNNQLYSGNQMLDISHLPQGIYFVQHKSGCSKIIL